MSESRALSGSRIDGAKNLQADPRTTLVVIGNFDGVHRGHRAILEASAAAAEAAGVRPVVLTFHPHPAEVLGRGSMPVLTTLERKIELIRQVDRRFVVVVEPFDVELARLEPAVFAERLLANELGARVVVVGQNFRFGRERAGDFSMLEALGEKLGFEVRAESMRGDTSGDFSSTRVREALQKGDLPAVLEQLDRPHALSGRVVRGAGRGRSLRVPTANLDSVPEALPPYGVYACLVDRLGPGGPHALAPGVANIGVRPTVGAGFGVEAHLFDFHGDLYDAVLRVHLIAFLRDERRFADLGALQAQIERDSEAARAALVHYEPGNDGAWF